MLCGYVKYTHSIGISILHKNINIAQLSLNYSHVN